MSTFLRDQDNVGNRLRKYGSTGKKKKLRVNKGYQRYFDGYVEYDVPRENGKGTRRQRVYVADYHLADLSTGKKLGIRALHFVLFLAALLFLALAGRTEAHFNMSWYVVIFEALSVGGIVLGLITLVVRYFPYMGKMTRWQFRQSVGRLRWIQRLTPIALLATALTVLISLLFYPGEYRAALPAVLSLLLAAALIHLSRLLEQRVPYITVPSGIEAPIGSVDITTMKEITPPKPKKEEYGGKALEELIFEDEDEDDSRNPRFF